jgi:predicted RNase H-like HicB family nuclease
MQPYRRKWETRHEAGERYFVARIQEFPQVAGDGATQAEALVHLREAFDDFVTWRLEDGLEIPEPMRDFVDPDVPRVAWEWQEAPTVQAPVADAVPSPVRNARGADDTATRPVSIASPSRRMVASLRAEELQALAS